MSSHTVTVDELDTCITKAVYEGDLHMIRTIFLLNPTRNIVNKIYSFKHLTLADKDAKYGTLMHLVCRERFSLTYSTQAHDNMIEIAKILVVMGAKLNIMDSKYGLTVLYRAIKNNHGNLVKFLLTAGADSEQRYAGHTPLTFACKMQNTSSMEILLEMKVNPNHLYNGNISCLGMMCDTDYIQDKMVKLLLENGADPNLGISPLYGKNITCESVQLMLAYGLNINQKKKEESSLFSLIRYRNVPVLLMLLSMPGIDKTCKNCDGQTLVYVITQIIIQIKFLDPPEHDASPSVLSTWMLIDKNIKTDMKNLSTILQLCME